MSAFDKVVGYDAIKTEFLQLIDMIKNPDYYTKLGARLPKGVLLAGPPGVGKSLLCESFVKEAGIPAYTVRRDSGDEDFIKKITKAFEDAKNNAPAIVFLDDIEKFANESRELCDCPEYVAVQSGIDSCKDVTVLTLATTNDDEKLPDSLKRAGRMDRFISVQYPSQEDAIKILQHYMSDKNIDPQLNLDDVVKMIGNDACSVLETCLNEAAIHAAFERSEYVRMEHILSAILRLTYDCPDDTTVISIDDRAMNICHEGGHLVVAECIVDGCIGLASIRNSGRSNVGGFVHRCKPLKRRPYDILVSLGGKVATELHYPNAASGCDLDLDRAYTDILRSFSNSLYGFAYMDSPRRNSDWLTFAQENIITAELKRYEVLARNILLANAEFFEKICTALDEKETLLYSDIQAIKKTCTIKYFEV